MGVAPGDELDDQIAVEIEATGAELKAAKAGQDDQQFKVSVF